jgi:hypothetical protein
MVDTGVMQKSFELAWADRRVGATQAPRRFLDYVIGGRSFYELHGHDRISVLGWGVAAEDERAADRLMSASADLDGRTAIAVCPEDGDLLCGAISARIVVSGDEIEWTDIALSSYDYAEDVWTHEALALWDSPELRFGLTLYRDAISERPETSWR